MTDFIQYPSWRLVPAAEWLWPNFNPQEMACRATEEINISVVLMDRLQSLRELVEIPLIVSSGYRSKSHDDAIRGSGAHVTGQAVDIRCHGEAAHLILAAAVHFFPRVGIAQNGAVSRRFVHLDLIGDGSRPSPWIWSY